MRVDRNDLAHMVRGSIGSFLITIAAVILTLCLHLLLTRIMLPGQYSAYAYAYTWISLLVIFTPLGFDAYLVKMVPIYTSNNAGDLLAGLVRFGKSVASVTAFVMLVCVSAVTYFLTAQNQYELFQVLCVAFLSIPLLANILIRQAVLRGNGNPVLARIPDIVVRPVLVLVFVIVAYVFAKEVTALTAMVSSLGAIIFSYVIGRIIMLRVMSLDDLPNTVSASQKGIWLQESLPFVLIAGLHVSLNYMDTLMVGVISGVENVGVYSVAVRVSEVILFGMQAINMVAAPMISRVHANNTKAELQVLVTTISRWVFFLTFPIVILILLFPEAILGVFGATYRDGYSVLMVLALGQLINASVGPVGYLLNMTGFQSKSMKVLMVIFLLNFALNIPAIYFYGISGAAIVTSILIALRNIVLWKMVRDLLGVDSSIIYALRK